MSGYAAAWCRFVVDHLQAAPVGSYDGLDRGVVRVDVGGSTATPTVGIWKWSPTQGGVDPAVV
jgi:hypothetical protein